MSGRRVDLRKIFADPSLRKELMVAVIQVTQAREGIVTSRKQAEEASVPGVVDGDTKFEVYRTTTGPNLMATPDKESK